MGSYGLVICLFLVGILSCVNPQTTSLAWAESIMCIVWLGIYSMSVGPIVYTIVAEIGSTRLRTQTVVLGRSMYYFANLIGGILEPYFMSPTAWNAKGKTVCLSPFPFPPSRFPPLEEKKLVCRYQVLTIISPLIQAFFWGALYFLTTVWGWFRLPETKDRTFEEMDVMFQRRVPSRKFASYDVNADDRFLTQ